MAAEIAKIYAKALFEMYIEDGCNEKMHQELNEFADVFRTNPELTQLLSAPLITSDEKKSVCKKIFDDNGLVFDFLCLLCDKGRAGNFTEIVDVFNQSFNAHNNIVDVTVTTSIPLTDELRKKLTSKLEAELKKTIVLKEKTDPSIIDGIVVEYNNKRIDSSVRSRLSSMKRSAVDVEI